MKKKYIYMIIGFVLIIVIIIGIFMSVRVAQQNAIVNKLTSTLWTLIRDEYKSTELVEFEGEPIIHSNIIINRESSRFCYVSNESMNEEATEECVEYKSSIDPKENKLTVYVEDKVVVYTYSFDENGELMLIYGDHRFSLIYYYGAAMG